jgi:hypothetical protein
MPIRRAFLAAVAATAALVVSAPAAGASTFPGGTIPGLLGGAAGAGLAFPGGGGGASAVAGPCGRPSAGELQGGSGTTQNQVCMGAGLSFVGPSVGQIATVIGPTIIGPAFVGASVVSAGNVAIGSGN